MTLTRRNFIKACGASVALLGVGAQVSPPLEMAKIATPAAFTEEMAVLIDTSRCIGCMRCQRACKTANHLPDDGAIGLTATSFTYVDLHNISTSLEKPVVKPVKWQCMHCDYPACVAVCPVGALHKEQDGRVVYDASKCIGCRYCMVACPFGIPKYDWYALGPKISKCTRGCLDGTRDTLSCVEACRSEALAYGPRSELLAMARDRIAKNPTTYVDHIYGENEVGGAATLYLSDTPFGQLGFRADLPDEPLPVPVQNVMEKVPWVLGAVLTLVSCVTWWTHRGKAEPPLEKRMSTPER
jgi:formate dehydrogenase iron-sulfur subunit